MSYRYDDDVIAEQFDALFANLVIVKLSTIYEH